MNFGKRPTKEALGCILAHGVTWDGGQFRKGRLLSSADIDRLVDAGISSVIIAKLDTDDVAEDLAARNLIQAINGAGTFTSEPFTGRANLYAQHKGLALINALEIAQFNEVDEAITLATVAPFAVVDAKQMLATVKIIPFGVPSPALTQAQSIAPKISVAPFLDKRIGLISTRLTGGKEQLLDKNREVLAGRLANLSGTIHVERRCAHDDAALADAILEVVKTGVDFVLIFGASAIVDRRDVIPAAIERAGGIVHHFGMPVDPGNLLLLGSVGDRPVIGLPGCARSPKLNGFDWVLQRLLCDVPVTKRDLTAMGAGGLLKEIASRPQPRDGAGIRPQPASAPKIGALLLAAGRSSRMGDAHKLLADINGKPLIRYGLEALLQSSARPITIVLGHRGAEIRALIREDEATCLDNPDFAQGLSTSLRVGLNALPSDLDAVLIMLADMPLITARDIDQMIAAFDQEEGRKIVVATANGKRGNPVLFDMSYRAELCAIEGDKGARQSIIAHGAAVVEVEIGRGALVDLDTPEALQDFRNGARP